MNQAASLTCPRPQLATTSSSRWPLRQRPHRPCPCLGTRSTWAPVHGGLSSHAECYFRLGPGGWLSVVSSGQQSPGFVQAARPGTPCHTSKTRQDKAGRNHCLCRWALLLRGQALLGLTLQKDSATKTLRKHQCFGNGSCPGQAHLSTLLALSGPGGGGYTERGLPGMTTLTACG